MRKERFELSRVAPYGPEPYAYASSATSAQISKFFICKFDPELPYFFTRQRGRNLPRLYRCDLYKIRRVFYLVGNAFHIFGQLITQKKYHVVQLGMYK